MNLTRTVLIAGGSGGIGKEVAKYFAAKNFRVAIFYYTSKLEEIKKMIENLPGSGHIAVKCNMMKSQSVEKAVNQVITDFEIIDCAVYSAAVPFERAGIMECSEKSIKAQLALNFFGPYYFFKEIGKSMKANRRGSLIGLTTSALDSGAPVGKMAPYIISKWAMRGLLKEFARELNSFSVRVNAVAPGFVDTKLNEDMPKVVKEFIKSRSPEGTVATPAAVAKVVFDLNVTQKSGVSVAVPSGEVTNL